MKKLSVMLAALVMLATLLCSCGVPAVPQGGLKIVCTTFAQYDFIRNILGSEENLILLNKNGADMHGFEPTAKDIIEIRTASLFVYVGGASDKWVEKAVNATENPDLKAVAMTEYVDTLTLEDVETLEFGSHHEHNHAEHSHEHSPDEADEHIWLSLKNAVAITNGLCGEICAIDPENAEKYKSNAAAYVAKLEALEKEYTLSRRKAKVFSLGDFGNGYKGYAFVYNGVRVAAVPKAELTGKSFAALAAMAARRTTEVFENGKNEFPDGFSVQTYVPPKTGFVNRFVPLPGDGKKEIIRKCVVIASALIFLGALWALFYNMVFLSVQNAQLNGDIQRIAHQTDDGEDGSKPNAPKKGEGSKINWDELKKINKEIVAWIQLKDTQIDYPVLWHKGDDAYDQYYLNHNYKGDYDSYGCIFFDWRCTKGLDSKNIVLHGHHMNDGSMFGDLMSYGGTEGDLDFYKDHPTFTFDTPQGDGVYKIISYYKTNTLSSHGEFFNYMVGNFQNEKDFMNYVYNVRIRSLINCPVDVNEDDELITLSTCSYEYTNFRTVLVARRVRIGENAKVDVKKASLNGNAVWPEVYYFSRGGTRPTVTDFCTAYEKKQIDWYDGTYDFKDQKVSSPTSEAASTEKKTGSSGSTVPTTKPIVLCSVTFINYDGSFIENQTVEYGKAAKAPKDPVKPSDQYYDYKFKGWQLDFSKVTMDMTIAPNFEAVLKPEYAQQ